MSEHYDWLPDFESFGIHNGDWDRYLNVLYHVFEVDFIRTRPQFRGRPFRLKRHPETDNKASTFWHLISEDDGSGEEADRIPDLRRCERIRWPRPGIENCDAEGVRVWPELRGKDLRIHIYLEHEAYLIVLSDRREYLLLWTAYCVERSHQQEKLLRKYEAWAKTQAQKD